MERASLRVVLIILSLIALSFYCTFHASSQAGLSPPPVLCPGSGAQPVMLGNTLRFCSNRGLSCCDAVDDAALMDLFKDMNVSDAACAAVVKAKLCERCSPSTHSTEMFKPVTTMRSLPDLLCTSTPSSSSSSAHHPQQGTSMCLEKIAAGSYLSMATHLDGSGRAFLSTHDGKIWLASIPSPGHHQGTLRAVDDGTSIPFLDLSGRVHQLKGMAFHPRFANNGRFFVSYSCDRSASPTCGGTGRCSSSVAAGNGSWPCRYQLVVAEFSAEGGADYSQAARANPAEVRRIFTMGLPQLHKPYSYQQHGGQILFQPNDSNGRHLYLISGYGERDSSMNRRSFLGKIIRLYVNHPMPKKEILAMGVSNPSGCAFDTERPSDLYCADVDQYQYETVYLISNRFGSNSTGSPEKTTVSLVLSHGRPPFGRMPSIVGGIVYRGSEDPSLKGRYLYTYGSAAWAAMKRSGRYVAVGIIPSIRCSGNTPSSCRVGISGRVLSLGEDNGKNAFVLTTDGVYLLVRPGLCSAAPLLPQTQPVQHGSPWLLFLGAFAVASALWQVYMAMFAASGPEMTQHNECCCGSITCWCCSSVVTHNNYSYNLPEQEADHES